jgi:NADH:ubiquinone oxidoreductase subunit K
MSQYAKLTIESDTPIPYPIKNMDELLLTFLPKTILGTEFLALVFFIFLIGLSGLVFNHKNFLLTLFSIEIMYLGITLSFIIVSVTTQDPKGQIYAILLLIIAAAESAIGLGMLIVLYRFGQSINFEDYQELKG